MDRFRQSGLCRIAAAARWLAVLFWIGPVAAQEFPYVAYVMRTDAFVRSGPGERHYPTGKLPSGYAVEVFRHDEDGWCAIRPPQGEFSLAPVGQLRIIDEKTAEVTAQNVVARVGSQLAPTSSAVQVFLKPGELVELMEKPPAGGGWARIAPPAGEFRWVAARDLSRQPPVETVAAPGARPEEIAGVASSGSRWRSPSATTPLPTSPTSPPAAAPAAIPVDGPFAHLSDRANAAGATEPLRREPALPSAAVQSGPPKASAAGSEQIAIVPGSPAALQLADFQPSTTAGTQAPAGLQSAVTPPPLYLSNDTTTGTAPAAIAATAPNGVLGTSNGAVPPAIVGPRPPRIQFPGRQPTPPATPRVAELRLLLSQAVVVPPEQWELAGLRAEAATLLAKEQDPAARDQFRDLLERIGVFERIQASYASRSMRGAPVAGQTNVAKNAPSLDPQGASGLAATGEPEFTGATAAVRQRVREDLGGDEQRFADPFEASEAKYDAVGTLKPVVSKRTGAPQYALVGDDGDVVSFITPGPDVDLSRYLGKRIGVNGARGYMPDYRRSHVTAARVRSIDQSQLR